MAEPIEGRKAPTHTLTGPTDTQPSTCRKTQYFTTRSTINNQEITPNDICESNNAYNLTMHTTQVKHPPKCLTYAEFPDFRNGTEQCRQKPPGTAAGTEADKCGSIWPDEAGRPQKGSR